MDQWTVQSHLYMMLRAMATLWRSPRSPMHALSKVMWTACFNPSG